MFQFQKLQFMFRRSDVEKFRYKCPDVTDLIVTSEEITSNCEKLDVGELLPLARSGHKAFFYSGAFYTFGGYRRDNKGTISDAWRYYPLLHHWEAVPLPGPIPEENLSCASAQLNEKLFLFGGSGAHFGETNSDKLYEVDMKSLAFAQIEWDAGEDGTRPAAGYGQSLAYSAENECLYLCCGTNGFLYEHRVLKFSLLGKKWSVMPPDKQCVTPRYRQESFVWRQGWYILGGSYQLSCHNMTCMYKFSFRSEKWELMPILPDPAAGYPTERRGFASVLYRNRLFIVGGSFITSPSRRNVLCELVQDPGLWYIDLPAMEWHLIGGCCLPTPVDFFAVAIDGNGKVIIHGGRCDLENNRRTAETYILWVDVPPLSELCWEKIRIWEKEDFLKFPLPQLMAHGLPRPIAEQVTDFTQSCI